MLSLCPKLVFLSSSSVFSLFFSLLTVKVSIEHWPAVWAILSPVPQHLHSGRGLPTLFQQKLDGYVGRGGAPSFPTPPGKAGLLRASCSWACSDIRPRWSWNPPACQTLLPKCNVCSDYSTKVLGFHFSTLQRATGLLHLRESSKIQMEIYIQLRRRCVLLNSYF